MQTPIRILFALIAFSLPVAADEPGNDSAIKNNSIQSNAIQNDAGHDSAIRINLDKKNTTGRGYLEEIVVTATRSKKLLQNTPYSVSVITQEQLAFQPVDQVAELLRDIPGVNISDAGQAGQLRIRIRGEEARRMAMLVDGQEFGDHREVGVPILIDPGEIERIELVRGPASVLYGPKALGGVVNIITRTPTEQLFSGRLSSSFDSATNGVRLTGAMGGTYQDFNWRLGYTKNNQNDRETPAGSLENTSYDSDSFSLSLGRVMDSSEIKFRFEDFNSSSEVFVEPEVRFKPPFVDFALEVPRRDRRKIALSYKIMPAMVSVDSISVDAYRQVSNREFNSFPSLSFVPGVRTDIAILTDSELTSDGLNIQANFVPGERQALVAGMQYVSDQIDQLRRRDVTTNGQATGSTEGIDRASLSTLAFYLQDDIALSEFWSLIGGVRYYMVDGQLDQSDRFTDLPTFNDSQLVKSIALTYMPDAGVTWRLNYSDGYIYPSLLNLAMGAFAGSRYINPAADLKPETSRTMEFGVRLDRGWFFLDAGIFATSARNYIDHLFCTPEDACLGPRDKIYRNVGEANSRGVELVGSLSLGETTAYTNVTWLKRKKEYEGVSTYRSGIPELSGLVGWRLPMSWRGNSLELDTFIRFASSSDELFVAGRTLQEEIHPGWGTLNANINFATSTHYKVALQLVNLTDKKYSTSTENLFAPGRSVRLMLSADL